MKRFFATTPTWRGGALAGALLLAVALAGPAAAKNTNLTATAKYSSSTDWESDQGNVDFVAAKAFDGDLSTRWNSASGDQDGSWLAATWDAPVTINKVVMYERFQRVQAYSIQQLDDSGNWVTAYEAHDDKFNGSIKDRSGGNFTFSVRLDKPITSKGMRVLFDTVTNVPSIAELEAYDNPAGTLTGTVTDASGKPIEGAVVSAGTDSATTDAAGKYTLVTDAGTYNVSAGKTNAFRVRVARGIELPANGAATHDFVLLPLPLNLSLTATAVSSSDWEDGTDYNAAKANDADLTTRWNSRADDAAGAWVEMQWSQAQTFNKVTIREAIGRIRNYSLQSYDEANDKYINIVTADAPPGTGDRVYAQFLPTPVTSKRLRLLVNVTDEVPSIYELEVANVPVATASIVVKDAATGNPVPNATITSDLGVVLGTTNDKGELALLLEPDDYVITAAAAGYFAGAPATFTINAGETQQITLTAPATGPNIAKNAKASASTQVEDGSEPATNINDGDETTFWRAQDPANQWVALTWDKPTHFTVVQIRGYEGAIQRSFLQVLADDGTTWVDLDGTTFAPQFLTAPANFSFPQGITTKGLRYFITATDSATVAPGVGEIIVFDSPLPKP